MKMANTELKKHRFALYLISCFGFAISIYSLYIEIRKEHDSSYEAMCDLSPSMSCSRVLTSQWSKGFGLIGGILGEDHVLNLPNCTYGLIFYCLVLVLGSSNKLSYNMATCVLSVLSNFGSVYLAYILFIILNDVCLVCITIYVINASLLVANILRYRLLRDMQTKSKVN